jgi:predicted transcriptional regulator
MISAVRRGRCGLSGTPGTVSHDALADTEELFEWERWDQAHMNAAHSDSDRGRYLQEAQADGSKVTAAAPSRAFPGPQPFEQQIAKAENHSRIWLEANPRGGSAPAFKSRVICLIANFNRLQVSVQLPLL